MSGECDKCDGLCWKCECHWSQTEEAKQQLLEIINQHFSFGNDGTIYCRECKNESVACVCMGGKE